jgi:uncharacterized protein YcbK (DUF882 family)
MQVSAHFREEEFRSRGDGTVRVEARLVWHLEKLRTLIGGRPIRIVSGYRDPAHNRRVGGAVNSRHLHGDAADIPRGVATVEQARSAGFTGIGRSGPWAVHVDMRPGPRREWTY